MKRFYVLLFSVLLISCSNDDDSGNETSLQGEWNLVKVSGGLIGLNQDFEKGIITWDFDESADMVTIVNNSTDSSVNTLLPSGTYSYSISAPADADMLIVNDTSYGRITLESEAFVVDDTFVDGFVFRFER